MFSHLFDLTPPIQLQPWLTHQQSLTHKLKKLAGDARLQILHQSFGAADEFDKTTLLLDEPLLFHREILMWAHNTCCWYARMILPKSTYDANSALFDRLKTEPLGNLIFQGDCVKRVFLTQKAIDMQTLEYQWLPTSIDCRAPILWRRLSQFAIPGDHPFFLVEILLPGLLEYLS